MTNYIIKEFKTYKILSNTEKEKIEEEINELLSNPEITIEFLDFVYRYSCYVQTLIITELKTVEV